MSNAERLIGILAPVFGDGETDVDNALVDRLAAAAEPIGENVLTLARQVGISRHGVEIEQPSAAVWKFRDGRLARLEFHLDRELAARSAQSAQE